MYGPETSSTQDMDMPSVGSPLEAKLVELDFLGAADLPVLGPPLCVPGPGGSIMDMLQECQKDLGACRKQPINASLSSMFLSLSEIDKNIYS